MVKYLMDSSALLALIQNEPGAAMIYENLNNCSMSAVNIAETFTKLVRKGASPDDVNRELERSVQQIIPFDAALAKLTGELARTRNYATLSLGDRACIATAIQFDYKILTSDTEWKMLELPVHIKFIR